MFCWARQTTKGNRLSHPGYQSQVDNRRSRLTFPLSHLVDSESYRRVPKERVVASVVACDYQIGKSSGHGSHCGVGADGHSELRGQRPPLEVRKIHRHPDGEASMIP